MPQPASRVYFVSEEGKEGERLIEGISQSDAIDIASSRSKFSARVPKQRELVDALRAGKRIENTASEQQQP